MPKDFTPAKGSEGHSTPPWPDQRPRAKVWLLSGLALAVLLSGLFIGYRYFMEWHEQRTLRSARLLMDSQDYRSAHMLLEQFVKQNPEHQHGLRLLAEVLATTDGRAAAQIWEKLTQADDAEAADYVGAATQALRLGDWDAMQANLNRLKPMQSHRVELHRLAAAKALALHDRAALRDHLEALLQMEPHNHVIRFSIATLLLDAAEPTVVEQARSDLETFARGNELRIRATLALINDAPRRWPTEKSLARQLTLLARRILHQNKNYQPALLDETGIADELVEHMKNQPALDEADAVALAHWLMRAGRSREALFWLDTLDQPIRQAPAVLTAMSACAVRLESWTKLEHLLQEDAWGDVPALAIGLAFEARTERLRGNESKARSDWTKAIELSDQSLPGLHMLQRLAMIWRWPDLRGQVLWLMVRKNPREAWAWPVLAEEAMRARDTAEVWRVYNHWAKAVPDNAQVRIERVLIGLLVRPDTAGLAEQADALLKEYPEKPVCHVIKALALWRAGQAAEGLALFESQLLEYSREPRFGLVYGLLLAGAERTSKSRQVLAALPYELLLPEEQLLVESVKAR